jgi:hypothetical protein
MLLIRLCFIIKQFPRNSKFEKNKKKRSEHGFFIYLRVREKYMEQNKISQNLKVRRVIFQDLYLIKKILKINKIYLLINFYKIKFISA